MLPVSAASGGPAHNQPHGHPERRQTGTVAVSRDRETWGGAFCLFQYWSFNGGPSNC
jgi:hypothetical protein